jgi:hypothetical protein
VADYNEQGKLNRHLAMTHDNRQLWIQHKQAALYVKFVIAYYNLVLFLFFDPAYFLHSAGYDRHQL